MVKLKNQSELTNMRWFGTMKGGDSTRVTGMDDRDTLPSARSCKIFSRMTADFSWGFGLRSRTVTASSTATEAENKPVYRLMLCEVVLKLRCIEDSRK
jgi:hypothetical protein